MKLKLNIKNICKELNITQDKLVITRTIVFQHSTVAICISAKTAVL
ncbi:MAG: hypothetical protein ACOX8P_09740 [Tepidanaerobacteraceae bacterium]|jgi:hypothetical protein